MYTIKILDKQPLMEDRAFQNGNMVNTEIHTFFNHHYRKKRRCRAAVLCRALTARQRSLCRPTPLKRTAKKDLTAKN